MKMKKKTIKRSKSNKLLKKKTKRYKKKGGKSEKPK